MRPYTEDEIRDIILNPYYAIQLKDALFSGSPNVAKEDWVAKNADLMSEIGIRIWLEELLAVLEKDVSSPQSDTIDPSSAITFAESYKGDHEPLVTREMWLDANQKSIEESGSESWLSRFLDTLQRSLS